MIWLIGLLLLAIAGGGIWYSVTRTDFLPRLIAYFAQAAWPTIRKLFHPRNMTAEERERERSGDDQKEGGR